jgi:hypothetical protein
LCENRERERVRRSEGQKEGGRMEKELRILMWLLNMPKNG